MSAFRIIGASGRARAGKDSIASILVEKHGFIRRGFADPLKNAAREIFGLTDAQLYGAEKEAIDPFWEKSPRQIMQLLGTECVRNQIDRDAWVKSMRRFVERARADGARGVVIPDARFPNEADAIRAWGGEVWRVTRPGIEAVSPHPSETALDDYKFDCVIPNEGTLETLADGVEECLFGYDSARA